MIGLRFNFITLFPKRIESYFNEGLPKKAIDKKNLDLYILNLRDFSNDKFKRVDDTVYGGGSGMLLKVEPFFHALNSLGENKGIVIAPSPSGQTYSQKKSIELFQNHSTFTFLSGYYEGFDHRIIKHLVDLELSLGNYVLSAGDLPALCIADSILRLEPNFMHDSLGSLKEESHNEDGVLEYPQYTKPASFQDWVVPDVLLSGNHSEIAKWKEKNRKKIN
jgi:tRNA (guanine37-N1)-methyltransferase